METPPPPPASTEHGLSDECRELLSTLPREKHWLSKYIYQYKGFWLTPKVLEGTLAYSNHFQSRDTDIVLATIPKSGTTWLKAMTFALLNRSRFNLDRDDDDHPLLTSNPHDLVPLLELVPPAVTEHLPSPRILSSHAPLGLLPRSVKNSTCKIVYLCRDPKDVVVSYWHFCTKMMSEEPAADKLEEIFRMFCEGKIFYGPLWDHVLGFWNESLENPNKVLVMKYEEIKEQPAGQLRRLAEFLGCPFSDEEESKGMVDDITRLCSFDHLSKLEVNKVGKVMSGMPNEAFFREGKVGSWAEVLTPEMAERVDRITEEKMGASGFKF